MKKLFILICLVILFSLSKELCGFENRKTHPALTDEAIGACGIDNYLKTKLGLSGGVSNELYWNFPADIKERMAKGDAEPDKTTRTILEWLKTGSIVEDEDGKRYPWRPRHHFHDPIRNAGLDNHTDHNDWDAPGWSSWLPLGESALVWATTGHSSYEPHNNHDKWGTARTLFYNSLKDSDETMREEYLAQAFLKLGCVLHLLEDQGVPAHTRNDFLFGHYRSALNNGNPLEGWVEDQVEANGGQCSWSGSGPVVFDKLAKYFDADQYAGDYLGDGQTPPEGIWGLAECSNYQFLSLSTVFGCTGAKYQFPHPNKEHTAFRAEYSEIEGTIRQKIYFDGSNYVVPHLARCSYTYYKKSFWGGDVAVVDSTNTTDDVNVFEDYADITMPRTIDYATGLINYFFRGRLDVRRGSADPNITTELLITNSSDNSGIPQVLKGGTFEIYRDDADETRTQIPPGEITFIPAWTEASILANDGGDTELVAQFAPPVEEARNYVVVYRGGISELPEDPDPDDPDAIAVGILRGGYEVFAWTDEPAISDKYGQVSDAPDGADFVDIAAGKRHCLALRSDGSIEAWGRDNYGQVSGKPGGNDFAAVAAGTDHSMALKSDGSIVVWGSDESGQITDKPSGNDFVAITAGEYHSLALKSDGTIVGWGGLNSYGECDAPAPDAGTVYTAIAAGWYHSLALQSDGVVKAWGSNNMGQTRIYAGATGEVHVAIAACFNYNLLLRDDGMLISWGNGDWLESGIPRYHYRQPDGTEFVALAAGWNHILALTSDGAILAWGWPTGDYPFDYFSRPVPEGIVFTDAIAAGYKFSLGLKAP